MFNKEKASESLDYALEAISKGYSDLKISKLAKKRILTRYNENCNVFLNSYVEDVSYLDSFQEECKSFVKDNLLPDGENRTYEVKYYATVEEVIEKSSTRIGAFNKFHIWTRDHVKNYLGRKEAKIWILRVYKLDEPQILKRSNGMVYANVDKPVKLEGKPVISDKEFNKLKEKILNTK